MDAPADIIFFLEQGFSYNQSVHNREDAMFSVVVFLTSKQFGKS